MKHATLSASTAYRWLKCPPSAVLNAEIPDNPSTFSEEGVRAHKLAEYKVKRYLEMSTEPTPPCDDEEMENATNDYLFFIADKVEAMQNPTVLVEQKLDYSRYVPHGYGTGDCVICDGNRLIIVDFKYGKGVAISARENAQMMCYALGALALFRGEPPLPSPLKGTCAKSDKPLPSLCDTGGEEMVIEMNIIQPRIGSESTWSITRTDLIDWAENVLKPTALLASEGKGDFEAGSHCRFCKVRSTCRARSERCLSLEKLREKAQLTDDEIAEVLAKIDDLVAWAKDIKAYATRRAQDGVQYRGFKLARGHSSRRYTDEKAVAEIVEKAGYDPWEYRILGIGAMTKMLGAGQFNSLLGDYIEKPEGNPVLIRTKN